MESAQQQEILNRLARVCPHDVTSLVTFAHATSAETGIPYADLHNAFVNEKRQQCGNLTIEFDIPGGRLHFTRPAPERTAPVRRPQPSTPSSAAAPDNAENLGFAAGAGAVYDPAEIGRAAREYQQKVTASGGRAKTPTAAEAVNAVLRERGLPVG